MTSNFPLVNQDELELRANSCHFFTRVHAWCYVLNKGPCMMPHCSPLGWQSHDIHLGKQLQLQGVYFWGQFKAIQLQQEFLENFKSVAQSGMGWGMPSQGHKSVPWAVSKLSQYCCTLAKSHGLRQGWRHRLDPHQHHGRQVFWGCSYWHQFGCPPA